MSLQVATAYASLAGKRICNEDFVGMVTPREPELSSKGMLVAIADGVSGNAGGRQASEYTVRGLLTDYYATPDTWEVGTALEKVLIAINSWIQQQASVRREMAGMATTLTALVLRGRSYFTAHVGDTRCYLLRGNALSRLTQDHVWDRPEMQHVLTRAIGLDSRLALDLGMGELHTGDIFLLLSDGVWASLTQYDIEQDLLDLQSGKIAVQACVEQFCQRALSAGSQDNLSACIVHILALPTGDLRDSLQDTRLLPVPPLLKVGQCLDGYTVQEVLHTSRATLVYRVSDPLQQRQLVLKTLHPERANDAQERSAFAHEAWLAKRVVARFFPQVIEPPQKNYLYYLCTWHQGASLQKRLDAGQHFTIPEVLNYGSLLVRAVGALHRRNVLHRDIKPDNIHLGDDHEIRLLDLGVAQSGFDAPDAASNLAGTPSFLAPEQFSGQKASRQTDLYATGVSLYYWLTRQYPYGEIEPFQTPRFSQPIPPSRYRPDLPLWLENVLLKAIARDPEQRFETAEEFLLTLERGASRPLAAAPAMPLLQRDPLNWWRSLALIAIVINFLLLYLLVAR